MFYKKKKEWQILKKIKIKNSLFLKIIFLFCENIVNSIHIALIKFNSSFTEIKNSFIITIKLKNK